MRRDEIMFRRVCIIVHVLETTFQTMPSEVALQFFLAKHGTDSVFTD
jgi:hypothetical protein